MKNKFLSLIILIIYVMSLIVIPNVADAATYDIYTYTVSGNEITITDCQTSASGAITIPSEINGYEVAAIGSYAFEYCSSLTSITIPGSVTSIGDRAFYDCTSLTSITIPDSVTSIGSWAFSGCTKLKGVYITDIGAWCGIEFMGYSANPLYYGKNLYLDGNLVTEVELSDSATKIGSYAFYNYTSLESITIPESVTSIGSWAFYNCTSLTSITIPDSVTSIGDYAFRDCTSLTSIAISDSVTSIGNYAFGGCTSLTSITIPDSVTSIGDSALRDCTSLTSIAISDSVTSIGDYALDGCISLTTITIPESVTSIGDWAFCDCTSLTSITIPDSVTSIGDSAFRDCTSLTSITIPDYVTRIGSYAFENCTSLTSITIPDFVISIGYYAFNGCDSLQTVYFVGDDSDWYALRNSIESGNTPLLKAEIIYVVKDEPNDFAPIPGVGSTDIEIPLSDIEGTVIYSNGEFSAETYVASSAKQLDSMIYHDRGTTSVGTDKTSGSVFSFGTQGWLKVNNALNAYVQENGDVSGAIHEVTFDIKLSSGVAYLYPCFPTDNRDAAASLVFNGSTLASDTGASYGTVPTNKWYRIKFTLDTATGTVYTSVNGAVVYTGVFGGNSLNSILYQTTADSTVCVDNIKYVVKSENSDGPTLPDEPGDGSDTNDFAPIPGVGSTDIEIPLSDVKGTVIYSNGEFPSETYVTSAQDQQLDPMIYQDKGASSVGIDETSGSVFSFGTQGYLTTQNALDAYVNENGNVSGTIQELTFDIKVTSGLVYLYPCTEGPNRDWAPSLVFRGTTLTNDSDGANYGTLPNDVWYRVKFTFDTETGTAYTSVNGAVVFKGVSDVLTNSLYSVLYQTTADSTISIDNIKYVVKSEQSDVPTPPDEPDDGDEFAPIPGVGNPDIEIPLSDIEGTVIYSNGEFSSKTYVSSSSKQLDSMIYHDRGTSSVGTDETSGSVFSFGTQGYLTTKNALDAYVLENGNVSGVIQELTFDIKVSSGLVFLYPCTEGNNRDWAPSLVFRGTTLTNDSDGAHYGTLPNDVWYRVKFTFDTETGTAYTSVNGAVVYKGVSEVLTNSLYSVLYQTTTDSIVSIDNIKYVVKSENSDGPTLPDEPGDDDDTDEFAPVPGVGNPDIEIPLSDVEGTVIYSNGEFPSETYVTSEWDHQQLDPMIYLDRGTSSVGTDETSGSVFSFGKQGYFTTKNALDAYVLENGNVPGTIHELTFDFKLTSGLVYIYPCGGGDCRDAAASLVFRGAALSNDHDGANYGKLPNDVWYRIKYTFDTATGTVYTSVNGAVVYKGVSKMLENSLYSVLYQQTVDTIASIDNIKYVVKYDLEPFYIDADVLSNPIYVVFGNNFHIPPATKEPYTFAGYYTEPGGKGTKLTDSDGDSINPFTFSNDIYAYPYFEDTDKNIISVEPDCSGAEPGETNVAFNVKIAISDDVQNAIMYVKYPSSMELKNVTSPFDYVELQSETKDGEYTVAEILCMYSFDGDFIPTLEYLNMMKLYFDISKSARPGTATVEITEESVLLGEEDFSFDVIEGKPLQINPKLAESISIVGSSEIIEPTKYEAIVYPDYTTDKSVTWSVDDETIATITSDGYLIPKLSGTVIVTAKSVSNPSVYATKTVYVTKKADISSITSDIGYWIDSFESFDYDYEIVADSNVSEITFTTSYSGGILKINGSTVFSGRTKTIALTDDVTTITFERTNVTKCDDSVYTITVVKSDESMITEKISENKINITFNKSKILPFEKAVLLAALYDEKGKLIDIIPVEVAKDDKYAEIEIAQLNNCAECKLMLWDAFSITKPLCRYETSTLD